MQCGRCGDNGDSSGEKRGMKKEVMKEECYIGMCVLSCLCGSRAHSRIIAVTKPNNALPSRSSTRQILTTVNGKKSLYEIWTFLTVLSVSHCSVGIGSYQSIGFILSAHIPTTRKTI